MEILGYAASILIGISLGLIGGGGSILTVPVLVYLFGVDPVEATAYSLFVVGATSMAGSVSKFRNNWIDFKTAFIFTPCAMITVFIARHFIIPAIPKHIITINHLEITKSLFLLLLFALLMLFSSVSMITRKEMVAENDKPFNYTAIILLGLAVGLITGIVGAGGGFMIIPALVLFARLPMKTAVGTSLFIMTINSLFGFASSLSHHIIDWKLLLTVTLLSIIGIIIGNSLSKKISGAKLKKGFGWFVLAMGAYIIIKEVFM